MSTALDERMHIDDASLEYVCRMIKDRSAIMLDASKTYLIQARLLPLAKQKKFDTLMAFIAHLKSQPTTSPLIEEVVDAMTTNETSFFRDLHPFDTLEKTVLPEIIEERQTQQALNIWCGASSSGQEPYTIAMILLEKFPQLASWKIDFWATDVSPTMRARCQAGIFSQIEVNRGLPIMLLMKYFIQDGGTWTIKEELRSMIDFRLLNLIQPWPRMPRFDIVFLRNVLIYFDYDTKGKIIENIHKRIAPDGHLFLGTAESMVGISDKFSHVNYGKTMVYRPN